MRKRVDTQRTSRIFSSSLALSFSSTQTTNFLHRQYERQKKISNKTTTENGRTKIRQIKTKSFHNFPRKKVTIRQDVKENFLFKNFSLWKKKTFRVGFPESAEEAEK